MGLGGALGQAGQGLAEQDQEGPCDYLSIGGIPNNGISLRGSFPMRMRKLSFSRSRCSRSAFRLSFRACTLSAACSGCGGGRGGRFTPAMGRLEGLLPFGLCLQRMAITGVWRIGMEDWLEQQMCTDGVADAKWTHTGMHVCIDVCMDGWRDGWMHACIRMDAYMDAWNRPFVYAFLRPRVHPVRNYGGTRGDYGETHGRVFRVTVSNFFSGGEGQFFHCAGTVLLLEHIPPKRPPNCPPVMHKPSCGPHTRIVTRNIALTSLSLRMALHLNQKAGYRGRSLSLRQPAGIAQTQRPSSAGCFDLTSSAGSTLCWFTPSNPTEANPTSDTTERAGAGTAAQGPQCAWAARRRGVCALQNQTLSYMEHHTVHVPMTDRQQETSLSLSHPWAGAFLRYRWPSHSAYRSCC